MIYSEQKYLKKNLSRQDNNYLLALIAICLVLFVGFSFIKAVWFYKYAKEVALTNYHSDVLTWLTLPADFNSFLSKPWTILTHFFIHDNVWKVFANMLWLWCFGYILQDISGGKKIIPIFIYGSLGGAVGFMLAYNLLPSLHAQLPFANSIGATAGVMAIAVVTTFMSPGYRIFPLIGGGIPLWALTTLYIISGLASVSFNDAGYMISMLAAAFTGLLFILFLKKGYDWSKWMSDFFDWIGNLFHPGKPGIEKSTTEKLIYKSSSAPIGKTTKVTQDRIDEILDKIHQKGYHFLTEEEKELLKKAGKEEI